LPFCHEVEPSIAVSGIPEWLFKSYVKFILRSLRDTEQSRLIGLRKLWYKLDFSSLEDPKRYTVDNFFAIVVTFMSFDFDNIMSVIDFEDFLI
jgi:hypothetical protein